MRLKNDFLFKANLKVPSRHSYNKLILLKCKFSSSSFTGRPIYPPPCRTYNPNSRGSDACRGSSRLWTRTLDRYTRAGLPGCVISTMSGPPPETTQNRIQTNNTHPVPGQKLKFLTPPEIEPGPPGWKAGTLPTTSRRRTLQVFS